jgi:aminopeptidase N
MAISPLFRNQAFDPDQTAAMLKAYQGVCRTVGLADRDDPFNDDPLNMVVAKQIIELAQSGTRNPTILYMLAMREFKKNPQ